MDLEISILKVHESDQAFTDNRYLRTIVQTDKEQTVEKSRKPHDGIDKDFASNSPNSINSETTGQVLQGKKKTSGENIRRQSTVPPSEICISGTGAKTTKSPSHKLRQTTLPPSLSASTSISVPRKWNPPAMMTNQVRSLDTRGNKTSQILSSALGAATPRLRVGLSRNYQNPKPLHSSHKWTP